MKYFFVEGTFTRNIPTDEKALARVIKEHQRFLEKGFVEGWILFSGPNTARDGGVLVMKMPSREDVDAFFAGDPMKISAMQDYHIVEFQLHDCQDEIRDWFR